MNTLFLLMAQYSGKAIVPIAQVCEDYFSPLTVDKLLRKILAGEIDLPVVRLTETQKSAKGVHLQDLANYLDARRAEAAAENDKLQGRTRAARPQSTRRLIGGS